MKSRLMYFLFVCMLATMISLPGFAQQGTVDRYKSATLDGTTGLFKTWDAESLRQGEFNITFGYDQLTRDPGQLTIGNATLGGAVGLLDRLEVFESFDVYRSITADNIETNRAISKPFPATIMGGNGSPYYTQAAPFIDASDTDGKGDFLVGLKLNLLSEMRGDPFSTGISGYGVFQTRDNVERLNQGLSAGSYQGGFAWLLSKTAIEFVRFHLNLGSNFYSDPEIGGTTLANYQNEFVYRGGAEFPVNKPYRIIAELNGMKYYGDGSSGLNPSNPLDLIIGMRVYPADWVSFGAGYQASLNHIEDGSVPGALAADSHGFVVQGAFGKRRNDPPAVSCAAAKPEILQEDTTRVRANAVDPERDVMTYSWSSTGGKVTGSGDTVTFDTADAAPGIYEIAVDVSDGKNQMSCYTRITVLKKNYPPTVVIEPASASIVQGESQILNAKASDPNKDPLTYAWTVDGQNLAATGPQITFGSEGRNPGIYEVKVAVSDGEASAESTADITVREKPNRLPTIECAAAAIVVMSGDSVALSAQARDPEGGALTYTWSSPVGKIEGTGQTVALNTTGVKAGSYTVTVTVEDPRGGKASCTTIVNVSERLSVTRENCGYFAYTSTRVDNCAKAILDDLSVRMKNEPQLRANIIGYVDGRYEISDKSLGERRAKAVAAYLEKKGVESSRLTVTNGNAGDPVGSEDSSAGRRLNRRAVIELSVR